MHQSAEGWSPVYVDDNLGVMSIGFMLPSADDAVIWRGPRKNGLIKQFLTDVVWNELDYLIIDTPPGTSDEHISIVQYLKSTVVDGAIVITTPQEVSMADVRKELNFCKKTGIPVLGIVENMADIRFVMFSSIVYWTSRTTLFVSLLTYSVRGTFPHFIETPLFSCTRVPMQSFVSGTDSGYKLLNSSGDDVTSAAIEK